MGRRSVLLTAVLVLSCDGKPERQEELGKILGAGAFVRIAATTVGDDSLEFWHEPQDECFGRFVIVARGRSGRLIDFCEGTFRSSNRPYCQSERYCAVVASAAEGGDMFFVYDSAEHRFLKRASPEHVHDGFIIVGDRILFSSCKTPEPVWMLDLKSGEDISLGRVAPQAADFAVEGPTVFVIGGGKTYELTGVALTPSRRRPPAPHATGGFELIRVRAPSGS